MLGLLRPRLSRALGGAFRPPAAAALTRSPASSTTNNGGGGGGGGLRTQPLPHLQQKAHALLFPENVWLPLPWPLVPPGLQRSLASSSSSSPSSGSGGKGPSGGGDHGEGSGGDGDGGQSVGGRARGSSSDGSQAAEKASTDVDGAARQQGLVWPGKPQGQGEEAAAAAAAEAEPAATAAVGAAEAAWEESPAVVAKSAGAQREAEMARVLESESVVRLVEGEDGSGDEAASGVGSGGASSSAASAIVPAGPRPEHYPKVLAVPLTRRPLFPGFYVPVFIKNPKLVEALQALKLNGTPYVGAFLLKPDAASAAVASPRSVLDSDGGEEGPAALWRGPEAAGTDLDAFAEESYEQEHVGGQPQPTGAELMSKLHEYGTFAQIAQIVRTMDGQSAQVLLQGHRRLRLTSMVTDNPLTVAVEHLKDAKYDPNDDVLKATVMEVVTTLKDLMRHNPLYKEHITMFVQHVGEFNASRMADFGAALTTADEPTLQAVLQELDVPARVNLTLMLLKKELELAKLQARIAKGVEEKMSGDQRRYLLMEQLKAIKKELGLEKDDKTALVGKFREKLEPFKQGCPEAVMQVIEEELTKLQGLESSSSEFNVTRNYLDWLTSLPWGHFSEENFEIARAQKVLDEDHYGLEDVKERILEFIAVGRLRGTTQGKIICLVGPPGVGKTSIGRSIATALNRKFYRFSVGGLADVAEIKGHRRTYVGAMPGKMVQCLKTVGSANPLVLIDEIDKLGRGYSGDPASALLELLDPEQNSSFLDHYLDVPIDLSKVLFVCTANVLDTIPGPLLDRMEVIRLVGYIADEKKHIARGYLEPAARDACGLNKEQVEVTDSALHALIETYCREAGVRNLQKHIERIYRKAALKVVRQQGDDSLAAAQQPVAQSGGASSSSISRSSVTAGETEAGEGAQQQERDEEHRQQEAIVEHILDGVEDGLKVATEIAATRDDSVDGSGRESDGEGNLGGAGASDRASKAEGEAGAELGGAEVRKQEGEGEKGEAGTGAGRGAKPFIVVDEGNLQEYAGIPTFQDERLYDETPVGVVMGLAWTAMGGSTLYVETSVIEHVKDKGGLKLTGQLGDVMRESATIAHTVARHVLRQVAPDNPFFNEALVHLHVPAGATPKDGPSAGCTMITSLLSLALGRRVLPNLAMTGEVTLTGRVLPIGGVKEKTIAARRSGVKTIIFPAANKRDFDELPEFVREGLDVHFVTNYDEVFKLALQYEGAATSASIDAQKNKTSTDTDDTASVNSTSPLPSSTTRSKPALAPSSRSRL